MQASIKHRIIRAGAITVLGSGISIILGIAVRSVIARVYGPAGMGEYSGFMMFLSLSGVIAAFALPQAVLKFTAEYEEGGENRRAGLLFSSVFIFLTLVCLLVGCGAYFFSPRLARIIHLPATGTWGLLLGITLIPAAWASLASSLFLGLLRNLRAFFISLSSLLTMLLLAAVSYLVRPIPVYFLLVAGYLTAGLIGIALARRHGFLRPVFSGKELRRAMIFSLPLLLMAYLQFVVEWLDRFTLGLYFGLEEMGIFSAGLVIFTAARRLPLSLTEVLVPSYSKISLRGREVLSRAFNKNMYFYAIIFFFIALSVALFSREVIVLLFSDRFLPAAGILLVLSGAFILSVVTNPGSSLLIGCGYTRLNALNFLAGTIFLVPALLIMTRQWGMIGAAAAKVLTQVVTAAGMIVILKKAVKLRLSFLPLLKLLIFTLGLGAVVALLKGKLRFPPLPCFFLLSLAYFGGLWGFLLGRENREYLRDIWRKMKSGKPRMETDQAG